MQSRLSLSHNLLKSASNCVLVSVCYCALANVNAIASVCLSERQLNRELAASNEEK